MSAFGNNLAFGISLSATDNTKSALSSARGAFASFARIVSKPITVPLKIAAGSVKLAGGGLGLLRDINLGLRPLLKAIDGIVTRGTALAVQQKSFQALTGTSAGGAQALARQLVQASAGTLQLAEAFQIANRGLGSGLNLEQLGIAIEFISKKSVATGKNASEAISTVITGLSRGSTLFLDDFGILVDGVEGVKRSFDAIKGAGAFDSLGPAAQKAETIRQAIAEMTVQTKKLNISTKDTFFIWQGTKSAIGDASDAIVKSIAGIEAVGSAIRVIGEAARSIADFMGSGGGFITAFVGSLDILTSFALDFGDIIGGSIATALAVQIKKVAPKIAAMFGITDDTIRMIEPSQGFFRTTEAAKALKGKADQQRAINGEGAALQGGGAKPLTKQAAKQLADLDRERRIISGDTNFEIRRSAAKRADDEIRARRANGQSVPYSERDRLVAQYRKEETDRRLAANDAKRGGIQGGTDKVFGGGDKGAVIDPPFGPTPPPSERAELGPSRPDPGDAAARIQNEQKRAARKQRPELSDAEKAARRKRQARKSVETLPGQIAKNVARLRANFRDGFMGGGPIDKDAQDAMIRMVIKDIETLHRDAGDSGMNRSGYGIENLKLGDGQNLGEYLDKLEDFLQRERSEIEPFGPSHPVRQRSLLRDRVRGIRKSAREQAGHRFGQTREEAFKVFQGLSDEQGRLTREGIRDMDREGIRGNLRGGIEKIERGTAMEPLIREAMRKLDQMANRAMELDGTSREVVNSILGLVGALQGDSRGFAAIAAGRGS